eukprot:CAMPEP_0117425470 /NCGR_PEP_ID=MMETSP0758-20121206/5734_1 /TAXON_ID=63605 /ORGANISM="Percolomonas cosmopolitus, Strain AE-1 (ATCC 50343)" /LENGTH=808 /DNA_ID=CAMNT_0005209971 /DNA_START=16 /DNA_END=2442 /DNA_ORIENTATION=+
MDNSEIDLHPKSEEEATDYVDQSDGEYGEQPKYTKEPKPRAIIYWGFIILFLVLTVLCVIAALVTSIFSQQLTIKDKTPNDDSANRNIDIDVPVNAIFTAMTSGFLALFVMTFLSLRVVSSPVGVSTAEGSKMYEISLDIRKGAIAFLKKEFQVLLIFVIGVVIILVPLEILTTGLKTKNYVPETAICFVVGAATSALTSIIGMNIATLGNVRTTNACRTSMSTGLRVAFNAGTVMGLSVVGLGLVMLSVMYLVFQNLSALAGFGFGASSIALFARVGGGIYTKAADVGADLVGKVEANIPEDDPRNPATIADNVGDNVGDVAGMGADLFESYVGSIIAACTLGGELFSTAGIAAPFYLAAGGILCSIIGSSLVSTREKAGQSDDQIQNSLLWAIRRGIFFAAGLNILVGGLTIFLLFPPHPQAWPIFLCFVIGLVAGVLIGLSTEFFTAFTYPPTKNIAKAGATGPATVIIEGLYVGMISSIFPVAIIVVSIIACVLLGNLAGSQSQAEVGPAGVYGIAIASVGMLSTLGVTLATDAYGPVADNAGGLAEMAHLPAEIRDRTDALDALGNTTAATGKGFAIGSAVLTALALMNAYSRSAGIEEINVIKANVMAGILLGALLPFVFAALTMKAVGSSAMTIIKEVRRQFKEIDGLLEGRPGVVADHQRCVSLCTLASLKYMIAPGVLAVLAPLLVGILPGGIEMLGGLLAGSLSSGFLLAVTMANAGGAWDNAKKYVEAGKVVDENGEVQGKGSEVHKAAVTGDTVGDPFKDTSGPALNILIKLMSIISLVLAPRIRLLPYQGIDLFA